MAVSGKTTDFEIPFLSEEDIPDMGAGDKAIAERVDTILGGIEGDATLNTDLALTIADAAITSRKLKPTIGLKVSLKSLTLTTVAQDVPDLELKVAPTVASKLVVIIVPYFIGPGTRMHAFINIDGSADGNHAIVNMDTPIYDLTGVQIYVQSLTAEAHTIKVQGMKDAGVEVTQSIASGSRMFYALFAS